MILNSIYKKLKITNKHCLVALGAIVTLGTAFTPGLHVNSIKNETDALRTTINNPLNVVPLNPIAKSDFQYIDVSKNFTYPGTASQLRAGGGGDVTITNFINLLYLEFLNPLAKANPELNIPPQPKDLPSFFLKNGIETKRGYLENHDGDTWSGTSPQYFPSTYPTTKAILKILNLLLAPLDNQPVFKELAAKSVSDNFNPINGFFNQFIDYVLTQPLQGALSVYHYYRYGNGTSLNTGLFDFDAGYYTSFNPAGYYTTTIGMDVNNQAIATLSDQINNFMYLLLSYVNFASDYLNTVVLSIPVDAKQKWTILNNLTTLGSFNTPQLKDAAALADKRSLIYNDSSLATVFTALPRFMINASYGDCPGLNEPTRDWGGGDNTVHPLLHYNGLISGYLNASQEHNEFIHSAKENPAHYWAYADTNSMNSLSAENTFLDNLVFNLAANAEANFLSS